MVRSSRSRTPHWLQYRALRWFLVPHWWQWLVSLRLGIATKGPLVPSMIFKSRTTKQLSKVIEQKPCSRSSESSMSLMRTSVISMTLSSRWLAAPKTNGGPAAG
jgi:hypothetical protein